MTDFFRRLFSDDFMPRSGGRSSLESRPGEGSVFRIVLPRVFPAAGEAVRIA